MRQLEEVDRVVAQDPPPQERGKRTGDHRDLAEPAHSLALAHQGDVGGLAPDGHDGRSALRRRTRDVRHCGLLLGARTPCHPVGMSPIRALQPGRCRYDWNP